LDENKYDKIYDKLISNSKSEIFDENNTIKNSIMEEVNKVIQEDITNQNKEKKKKKKNLKKKKKKKTSWWFFKKYWISNWWIWNIKWN